MKKIFIFLSCIIIFSLTACDSKENDLEQSNTPQEIESQEDNQFQKENNEDNENEEEPDLEGEVISFSDTGLLLSQATISDDGKESVLDANGADSKHQIKVTYLDDTVFKIKEVSRSTFKVLSVEDATKRDVKKNSSLTLYGDFKDSGDFQPKKILIFRWQD